jgi:hypothetical protein
MALGRKRPIRQRQAFGIWPRKDLGTLTRTLFGVQEGIERNGADGCHYVHGSGHGKQRFSSHFANELLEKYDDPYRAARKAGYVRIRPVLMTALAMIIGMVPMAFGLGNGGEQKVSAAELAH